MKQDILIMTTNPKYNHYKELHPDWSEEQIIAAVSIEMNAENVISREGKDVNPDDPDLIREILVGARDWLEEVLPNIFAKVSHFFESLLSTIGDWVAKGLTYVVDAIAYLLGRK